MCLEVHSWRTIPNRSFALPVVFGMSRLTGGNSTLGFQIHSGGRRGLIVMIGVTEGHDSEDRKQADHRNRLQQSHRCGGAGVVKMHDDERQIE